MRKSVDEKERKLAQLTLQLQEQNQKIFRLQMEGNTNQQTVTIIQSYFTYLLKYIYIYI